MLTYVNCFAPSSVVNCLLTGHHFVMKHVEVTKQCDVEHVYEQLITVTNS